MFLSKWNELWEIRDSTKLGIPFYMNGRRCFTALNRKQFARKCISTVLKIYSQRNFKIPLFLKPFFQTRLKSQTCEAKRHYFQQGKTAVFLRIHSLTFKTHHAHPLITITNGVQIHNWHCAWPIRSPQPNTQTTSIYSPFLRPSQTSTQGSSWLFHMAWNFDCYVFRSIPHHGCVYAS